MTGLHLDVEVDGRVLEHFLTSPHRVSTIQGPWGSGKSRTTCYRLFLLATGQLQHFLTGRAAARGRDGVRRRRTYVIRNTYDDLKRTTVKTWLQVFPEDRFGVFKWSRPFEHRIRLEGLDWEVVFLALDEEADRKKLLSAEISDIWFNEAREIERGIIDDADGRIARYPPKEDGGCDMPTMSLDTNPPGEDHWIAVMSGQVAPPDGLSVDQLRTLKKPATWEFFLQPPAMFETLDDEGDVVGYRANPEAENLRWLPDGYYPNLLAGKSRSWIRVNVLNKPGSLVAGKPVWPQFREEAHVARAGLAAIDGHAIFVGVDFGLTPAAVFGQRVFDRWFILGELVAADMGARRFARLLRGELAARWPGWKWRMFGDPAGDTRAQSDESTPFQMFRAEGLEIRPAPTNDPTVRVTAVEELLLRLVDGKPGFLLDPGCTVLKAAMAGGYQYRRLQVSGERYAEEPEKNKYSHVADALQYMAIGAGEGRAVLRGERAEKAAAPQRHSAGEYDPFSFSETGGYDPFG